MKGSKGLANAEANKNKLVEQTLLNYPEHKVVHQTHMQIPHDTNKSTQQYIKDLGNDFLKDFIEKNFNGSNKMQLGTFNSDLHNFNTTNPGSSTTNPTNNANSSTVNPMININTHSNHSYNGLGSINSSSLMAPQQTFTLGSMGSLPQITGLGQFNQFGSHHAIHGNSLNQKRQFEGLPDFELKNEQINDISVKKFKSGEDALWDYDLDKSKRDLEDFIYKTHHAIKNNTYVESKNYSM